MTQGLQQGNVGKTVGGQVGNSELIRSGIARGLISVRIPVTWKRSRRFWVGWGTKEQRRQERKIYLIQWRAKRKEAAMQKTILQLNQATDIRCISCLKIFPKPADYGSSFTAKRFCPFCRRETFHGLVVKEPLNLTHKPQVKAAECIAAVDRKQRADGLKAEVAAGSMTLREVKAMVAAAFGLQLEVLERMSRLDGLVHPRWAVFFVARELGFKVNPIAASFLRPEGKGMHHSAVSIGAQSARALMKTDREFNRKVRGILADLMKKNESAKEQAA